MPTLDSLLAAASANLWTTAALVFIVTTLALVAAHALAPRPPPLSLDAAGIRCGDITAAELAKHDGQDAFLPIYMAVKGVVYDVTTGRSFYGPGELDVVCVLVLETSARGEEGGRGETTRFPPSSLPHHHTYTLPLSPSSLYRRWLRLICRQRSRPRPGHHVALARRRRPR